MLLLGSALQLISVSIAFYLCKINDLVLKVPSNMEFI